MVNSVPCLTRLKDLVYAILYRVFVFETGELGIPWFNPRTSSGLFAL